MSTFFWGAAFGIFCYSIGWCSRAILLPLPRGKVVIEKDSFVNPIKDISSLCLGFSDDTWDGFDEARHGNKKGGEG